MSYIVDLTVSQIASLRAEVRGVRGGEGSGYLAQSEIPPMNGGWKGGRVGERGGGIATD